MTPTHRPWRARTSLVPVTVVTALVATGAVALAAGEATAAAGDPYLNASLPVSERVSDLMSRMTLDDKIGQMTQADIIAFNRSGNSSQDIATYRLGSVLAGGGSEPSDVSASGWASLYDGYQRTAMSTSLTIPIIFGIDAVHGHNNVRGATIFPHNIGLGATRDPDLVERIGRATAEEMAGTGADWTFAPCLCVARNDRWGRTYESFGETPEIVTPMTTIITGLQGSSLSDPTSVLATAKHYLADGGTTNGTDQGNTQLSEAELHEKAWPLASAEADKRHDDLLERFGENLGTGKATHDAAKISQEAEHGRVDTLVLTTLALRENTLGDASKAADLDAAVAHTLRNSGTVDVVPTFNEERAAGAIFRF